MIIDSKISKNKNKNKNKNSKYTKSLYILEKILKYKKNRYYTFAVYFIFSVILYDSYKIYEEINSSTKLNYIQSQKLSELSDKNQELKSKLTIKKDELSKLSNSSEVIAKYNSIFKKILSSFKAKDLLKTYSISFKKDSSYSNLFTVFIDIDTKYMKFLSNILTEVFNSILYIKDIKIINNKIVLKLYFKVDKK